MPAKTTKQSKDVHNPYGYSEMDWAVQLDPAYAAARAEVRRLSVGEEGTLSVKVKELIVLGILASRGLQYGVEAHMRRALDYGATKEELFEAIKAAAIPGGGVAYSVGVRALQTLEQDGAFPPPSPPRLCATGGVPLQHRPALRHPPRAGGAAQRRDERVALLHEGQTRCVSPSALSCSASRALYPDLRDRRGRRGPARERGSGTSMPCRCCPLARVCLPPSASRRAECPLGAPPAAGRADVESFVSHRGGTAPAPHLTGHEPDAGRSRHRSLTDQPYSYRTVVGVTPCVCQPREEAAASCFYRLLSSPTAFLLSRVPTYMLRPMHRRSYWIPGS
jgi:AhpD family alkylhydroperoxidase